MGLEGVQTHVQVIGRVCGVKGGPRLQLGVQVSDSWSGFRPVMVNRVGRATLCPSVRSIVMREIQGQAAKSVHGSRSGWM